MQKLIQSEEAIKNWLHKITRASNEFKLIIGNVNRMHGKESFKNSWNGFRIQIAFPIGSVSNQSPMKAAIVVSWGDLRPEMVKQ